MSYLAPNSSFSKPFASLTTMKSVLGITDSTDDVPLAALLLRVSEALEGLAGRKLRRVHAYRERFVGFQRKIRLSVFPVVKIHYIRVSSTGEFENSSDYEELDYGTDWRWGGESGAPGEEGWIVLRAISGVDRTVEVCYSGGYKTEDEVSLQNGQLTINGTTNTSLIKSASASARYGTDGALDGYMIRQANAGSTVLQAGVEFGSSVNNIDRAAIVFNPGEVLLPTWQITNAVLTLYTNLAAGSGTVTLNTHLLPFSAMSSIDDPETLFEQIDSPTGYLSGEVGLINTHTRNSGTMTAAAMTIHSDAAYSCASNMKILNRMLRETGRIGFSVTAAAEVLGASLSGGICRENHGTSGQRPSLVIDHRDSINDELIVPADIQDACLVQSIAVWQTRTVPSITQEAQRGVSIASGVVYQKDPTDFLPYVRSIMDNYVRPI